MHAVQSTNPTILKAPINAPVLTRELLAAGGAAILARQHEPAIGLLSDAERRASLANVLKGRPAGDLWIFAYGSLIWNPAMRIAERRLAHVQGWHRSFCLSMTVGRGSPAGPGLVLGLDRGGACGGVAYRIAERDIASELPILWNREMLIGGYNPIWVDVVDDERNKLCTAISFRIDYDHEQYAGDLPMQEKVRRLATAKGSWGSSADYLFRTIRSLRECGIRDGEMERLGDVVSTMIDENLTEAA